MPFVFSSSKDGIVQPNYLTGEERDHINSQKNAILYPMLKSSIEEVVSSSLDSETKSIQRQNRSSARKWGLLKKLSLAKRKMKLFLRRRRLAANWLYLLILGLLGVVVGYIVFLGWAEKPSVNIEFNVGEIIGGILAGAGALLAGGAYAVKTLRESGGHKQNQNS